MCQTLRKRIKVQSSSKWKIWIFSSYPQCYYTSRLFKRELPSFKDIKMHTTVQEKGHLAVEFFKCIILSLWHLVQTYSRDGRRLRNLATHARTILIDMYHTRWEGKYQNPHSTQQKCVSEKKRLTNKPRKKKKVLQMKTRSSGCSPTAPCQMIYFKGILPKQSGLQWFHLQI